ncbi:MAG: DUF6591 domain-containing protein [Bifidobacterium bifidum]
MNEYADFMEKYNAGGHPESMAADYAKIMVKYNDAMKQLFTPPTVNSLTPEEQRSTDIEVQTRVNQRLASVGASTAQ